MADTRQSSSGRLLSDTAYHLLHDQLVRGELAPGERLTERRAAHALGLDLSAVRDALTRLARDGLIEGVVPGRGYRVARPSLKSVDDLFQAWFLLGPEIARLGVPRATPEQAVDLLRLADEGNRLLGGAPEPGRAAGFVRVADAMFELLSTTTGNDRLLEVYRSLTDEMGRVGTVILGAEPLLLADGVAGWEHAIQRRDGEQAARIARGFIQASHAAAVRVLRQPSSAGVGEVVPLRM